MRGTRLAIATILAWIVTSGLSLAALTSAPNEESFKNDGESTIAVGDSELAVTKPPPEVIFNGGFDLPAAPPPNDTCATATSISVGASVMGTTVGSLSDYDSGLASCTGFAQAGGDVAYKVVLGSAQTITVQLTTPDVTFDPSISLLGPGSASNVCNAVPVTCLVGADATGFGASESFMYTTIGAGTYYIIVDTYYGAASDGRFTLNVTSP